MNKVGSLQATAWMSLESAGLQPTVDDVVVHLTQGMLQANEDAYGEFSKLYARRLFRYLLVITRGDEASAKELVQQTMIKVARSIRLFRSEQELWNWLAVLARNCAIDEQRKNTRHWSMLLRFWDRRQTTPEIPDETDFSRRLGQELHDLEEGDRALLEKKYFDGASVRELAETFETTEKAIESKLSRLRKKLKEAVLNRTSNEKPGE